MALICAGLLCQCGAVGPAVHHEETSYGQFAQLRIYIPEVSARQLVLLLSGDGGWGSGLDQLARKLTLQGALVAGIDVRAWLARLQDSTQTCVAPGAYLADLSHFLQTRYQLPLQPAVLIGHSAGGSLAYVALAQARPQTFAGAITLSFCADLDLSRPLCPGEQLREVARAGGVRLLPGSSVPAPWIALHGIQDRTCPVSDSREFSRAVAGARFVPLPGVGHGYDPADDWWPLLLGAYRDLTSAPTSGRPPQA
jgi:type IV secretory pathway VirJ component